MPRQNEYFDYIDREGMLSFREHYDRQCARFVPPQQETATMTTNVNKKLVNKNIDRKVDECFRKHGNNVQIQMMDIPDIFKAGHEAYAAGQSIEDAVVAAIQKYRKN